MTLFTKTKSLLGKCQCISVSVMVVQLFGVRNVTSDSRWALELPHPEKIALASWDDGQKVRSGTKETWRRRIRWCADAGSGVLYVKVTEM